jgi:hypothetical protein
MLAAMKKFRLLLLDANVVIQLFELGLWKRIIAHCEILLARTVAEREAQFFFDADGQHEIDLTDDIESKRIVIVDVPPSELKGFMDQFGPLYLERLDAGEAESLAYLAACDDPCLICSGDAIVFRVLAQLGRVEQGLSLEEVLEEVGFGRTLPDQFTKRFRVHWTKRGQEERIRGLGCR